VPDDALAVARGTAQVTKPGARFKRERAAEKAAKSEGKGLCAASSASSASGGRPLLLEALRRLEYRGYDSAGHRDAGRRPIERRRAEGKLDNLAACSEATPLPAPPASATRAGRRMARRPSATPIRTRPRVAVVHNGIIENFAELRDELRPRASSRPRPTPRPSRLVDQHLSRRAGAGAAAAAALEARLDGAFALAMLFAGHDDLLIGARQRRAARGRLSARARCSSARTRWRWRR
jgi:glutamine---fructose-6-phosphate transaminase (isomerizing)